MLKRSQFNYYSTYLIGHEAEKRGIKVKRLISKGIWASSSMLDLRYKNKREIIIGQRISKSDVISYFIQKNKEIAKMFFEEAGIAVPAGLSFRYDQVKDIIRFCHKIKYPVVIKPAKGIQGKKVYLGIDSDAKVKKILKNFSKGLYQKIIVEKEFKGEEYRIFATKDKFVAAIHRVPANVVGDGLHTIEELIKLKNKDVRRGEGHKKSLVKIKVDDVVREYLAKTSHRLSDKPAKGELVYLRPNSNISTGGDSIDVTDIIHPQIKKLAVKIIRSIPGLAYGGIDYLTNDITKPPKKNNYAVIEVNDSPMISMHHIPYQGKERNAAKEIIDLIFPETKNKKK